MSYSADTRPTVFSRFPSQSGELATHQCKDYTTTVFGWNEESPFVAEDSDCATFFGYVVAGNTMLRTATSTYQLVAGQFFSVAPPCSVGGGVGMIVRHTNFRPLQLVGGPIEDVGRLRYISGCTDTLLIPPLRRGDPCLNALYFPPNTEQQPHTHPSIRVGVVALGRGEAVLPDRIEQLNPGDVFVIFPDELHSFRTPTRQQMTVIAYHPDSDFGPEDGDHPMINRTIIDGLTAGRSDSSGDRTVAKTAVQYSSSPTLGR